jgi:hypothetical protein
VLTMGMGPVKRMTFWHAHLLIWAGTACVVLSMIATMIINNRRAFLWENVSYFSEWHAWWAWYPVTLHHTQKRAWGRWVMRRWGVIIPQIERDYFNIRWQYEEPLTAMMFPEGVPDDQAEGHSP